MSLQVGQIDIKTLQTVESRTEIPSEGAEWSWLRLQSAHNWPQIIITSPQQSLKLCFESPNNILYK